MLRYIGHLFYYMVHVVISLIGYSSKKVPGNAVRVSRLLAWCGNFLNAEDGANLAGLLQ